ncbi:MAG: DNA gyrase subunit A, partial [Candidatus Methylomirabilis sp.]|nr:DNA gyrase subunit A [Deltaproteobacteria bacterium]
TEVRMDRLASELLADLDKDTVPFQPNYDESEREPTVLPARFPNLLVNGSAGIAVGMATNIPPHNLREICAATRALIDDPGIAVEGLMKHVRGPDFPTAGFIQGREGIESAYRTGRGIITLAARAVVETNERTERESIVVTELPYQVNKARLIEKMAELVREKKIEGISDLRDESDRDGMRIVIELKTTANAKVVLNNLYKHTSMRTSFGIINLALDGGVPRVLDLKEMLKIFVDHRFVVVTRRTMYDLRQAEARAHILEGLKIALDHLDEIIALIRAAADPEAAKAGLMGGYGLTDVQAQAILDLRLQRLTALERDKIVQELEELRREMARLREILASPALVYGIIKDELAEISERYGDARRTEIVAASGEIDVEDLIVQEDMVVTVSHTGYIKRNAVSLYRAQGRGGKGKVGMTTKEEDFVEKLFVASTHDYILFFTTLGRCYWLKVYDVPQAGRAARGKAIVNLLELGKDEKVAAMLPVRAFEDDRFIVMATSRGIVKKTELKAFAHPRRGGIIAITIDEGDALIGAELTDGHQDVFLSTSDGKSIRFDEEEVRPTGRGARGVKGITLTEGDAAVGMDILREGATILSVTENGYGKRTPLSEYKVQGRGGQGIITIKTTERNGKVVGVAQVDEDDEVMIIANGGKIIRMRVDTISVIGRNTQGVRLMDRAEGQQVVAITT